MAKTRAEEKAAETLPKKTSVVNILYCKYCNYRRWEIDSHVSRRGECYMMKYRYRLLFLQFYK